MDKLDRDHLAAACESPGYALIRERYTSMLRQAQIQLEIEMGDVRYLQGQIFALRRVMEIPSILAKEIDSQQKRKTHAD